MENNVHSEKEVMVFNGVTKLMNEGVSLDSVKVADIAKAAGIGKGTIYDYFSSKEEILLRALLYNMNTELSTALKKINAAEGFKGKFYTVLDITENHIRDYNSSTSKLAYNLSPYQISGFLSRDMEGAAARKKLISDTIEIIAALGVKEGIIKVQEDKEYQAAVFISAVLGFENTLRCCKNEVMDNNEGLSDKIEEKKYRAYKLLVKALN